MALHLKQNVTEALFSFLKASDEGIDNLIYPFIQDQFIKPIGSVFPEHKDLTREESGKLPQEMIDRLFQSVQENRSFFPIVLMLLAGGGLTALMTAFSAAFAPLTNRYITQQVNRYAEPTLPSPMEIITALHRRLSGLNGTAGDISVDDVYNSLSRSGFDEKFRNMFMDLYWNVPGVQDLITFAVREVYSPEIAEKFGQFEGLDEVWSKMAQDAENAGLRKEEFSKYWAAHWVLPSVQQGFEMLHRRIIDSETLDKLMVALDIMPWWRTRLKHMSYNPLTRVDVRRMHKLGILSEDDVYKAYQDLGYDETNARRMTDFTLAYNADPDEKDQNFNDRENARVRELTKSDILRALKENQVSDTEAREYLQGLGYSPENSDILVSRVEYEKEADLAREYTRLIHEGYLKEVYSRSDVINMLSGLNFPADHIDHLVTMWDIEQELKASIPTKAELKRFLQKGIISSDQYRTELLKRKYTPEAVSWYIQDAEAGE